MLVHGDATYQSRPESIGDVVREPESSEGRLVVMVKGGSHVTEDIIGLRVAHAVRHEGRDDDMMAVDLQGHFKLLQKLDIFLLELVGDVLLQEQLADLSNPYRKIIQWLSVISGYWPCI